MPPPFAATRNLPDVLTLLDTDFVELAAGVADGAYAIWLGSGISFDQMPKLLDLPEIVLEHLRVRMSAGSACPYEDSLIRILALTPLTDEEKAAIDFSQPVSTWLQLDLIRRSLVRDYARMMDQAPADQAPDYLLWNGVEVVRRYADPTIAPGVEHLALAALVVEGVAPDIASGNWDGLVEAAVTQLAGNQPGILQVRVLPAEYRLGARLYKFHGCAVLAGQNEAAYPNFPDDFVRTFALTHRGGHAHIGWSIGGERELRKGQVSKLVFADPFEQDLVGMARSAVARLQSFGLEGPWAVIVTLMGLQEHSLLVSSDDYSTAAWRDGARLPEVLLDVVDEATLTPLLKAAWLLFGMVRPADRAIPQG